VTCALVGTISARACEWSESAPGSKGEQESITSCQRAVLFLLSPTTPLAAATNRIAVQVRVYIVAIMRAGAFTYARALSPRPRRLQQLSDLLTRSLSD